MYHSSQFAIYTFVTNKTIRFNFKVLKLYGLIYYN